ncbi:hypothetical protein [Ferruginibacter sp. SUN106]|uniref:hypothetical protein n=1 Tax=Ferruginibacter sp. SUN106 TaxID=2978348 RepID=UPI003D3623C0
MTHKAAAMLNYTIAIVLLTWAFFALKKKIAEQPDKKLNGFSWKTLRIFIYAGIASFVLLMIAVLAGLE